MKEKIQRFGGAMYTPVLLFAFAGIMVGISSTCMNPAVVGNLAQADSVWFKLWSMIYAGANTVFNQIPILFAISLPIALAKKQNARACMETFVIYMTFNYFLGELINHFGGVFGVDYNAGLGGTTGLALIGGVKTLDTGMIGAIIVAAIAIYLHNRFYDTELPDFLGVFKGAAFVVILGFLAMIPVAVVIAFVWPTVQHAMLGMQNLFASTGIWGVGAYNLVQKLTLPFGIHHFIYAPILFDSVIVENGTIAYWSQHVAEFMASSKPLIEQYPLGTFSNGELAKVFGVIGVALAFYKTARPEKRKAVVALMVPACLTAMFTGITEPLEFTFLFVAPLLYVVYSVLCAAISVAMSAAGVVGNFGQGILNIIFVNIVPLWKNNASMYVIMFVIGIAFVFIFYFVTKFMIEKFDYATPGREKDEDEVKLYSKAEYDASKKKERYDIQGLVNALGGRENIVDVTNCATRLRVSLVDENTIADIKEFKKCGAVSLVKQGKMVQVIIGVSVPEVREKVEELLKGN